MSGSRCKCDKILVNFPWTRLKSLKSEPNPGMGPSPSFTATTLSPANPYILFRHTAWQVVSGAGRKSSVFVVNRQRFSVDLMRGKGAGAPLLGALQEAANTSAGAEKEENARPDGAASQAGAPGWIIPDANFSGRRAGVVLPCHGQGLIVVRGFRAKGYAYRDLRCRERGLCATSCNRRGGAVLDRKPGCRQGCRPGCRLCSACAAPPC